MLQFHNCIHLQRGRNIKSIHITLNYFIKFVPNFIILTLRVKYSFTGSYLWQSKEIVIKAKLLNFFQSFSLYEWEGIKYESRVGVTQVMCTHHVTSNNTTRHKLG